MTGLNLQPSIFKCLQKSTRQSRTFPFTKMYITQHWNFISSIHVYSVIIMVCTFMHKFHRTKQYGKNTTF